MAGALPATPELDFAKQPRVLRDHQVRTLPSLQAALEDLVRTARERGVSGPINLADFDPLYGVNVSLNDDGTGQFFIAFRRRGK